MARKKESIGVYPLSEGFDGLGPDDVAEINAIFEQELGDDFFIDLVGELNGWLLRFGAVRELRYGSEERRLADKARRAARDLALSLDELGEIGTVVLDRFAYRQRVESNDFLLVLRGLADMTKYLDEMAGEEINAAAFQMHALAGVLRKHGIQPTVAHDTRGPRFNPSRFVRLVDCLWRIEPRLQLFSPRSSEYWPNISQWVSARLAEEVDLDAIKLVRRKRLN